MDYFELTNLTSNELKDIFTLVSNEKKMSTAVIEKDFWVTVLLKYLFSVSPWKSNLLFKGGTCLSKCYNAIERFSEDIDIVLDWRILGYDVRGPNIGHTKKQVQRINDEMIARTKSFLTEKFIPVMKEELSKLLSFDFDIDYSDRGLIFRYPVLYKTNSVKNEILIEIGPRGTWCDSKLIFVGSYLSEILPGVCNEKIPVVCTSIERTFCEKTLIIHSVATKKQMPDRYSRHYYDVYSLSNKIDLSKIVDVIEASLMLDSDI